MKTASVIAGVNAVTTQLRRGDAFGRLLLKTGKLSHRLKEIEDLARRQGLEVDRVAEDELDRTTGVVHQGVALISSGLDIHRDVSLGEVLDAVPGPRLFLVLDGVTDPRNLGACLRSAATLGVAAVIVPKDNSAPLNAAAIKTASGGAALVPLIQVVNLARGLDELKSANVWVVGTILESDQALDSIDLTGDIAIVMGSEEKGLRQNTIKHCDFLAQIPMTNPALGFNVSVAAGICLYEAQRQRRVAGC